MTQEEIAYLSLLSPQMPAIFRGHHLPSPSHCVGTGKLIGDLYGRAIVEECKISMPHVESLITRLACLLRAFIVIDDFSKDTGLNISNNPGIDVSLNSIRNQCHILITSFGIDADTLWTQFEEIYQNAYTAFDYSRPYISIINKCYLIFLPFCLPVVKKTEYCSAIEEAMKEYLFCLQLMDDFRDIEEDADAPYNHNLFVAGMNKHDALAVAAARPFLARALFIYVERRLSGILKRVRGETAVRSICHSIEWVREKTSKCTHIPLLPLFTGDYQFYRFHSSVLFENAAASPCTQELLELSDIRAETMHTVPAD